MVIKLTNVSKYFAQNASGMKTMHRAPLEMKTFEYCSLRNFKPTVLNTKRNEEFSPYIQLIRGSKCKQEESIKILKIKGFDQQENRREKYL